MTTQKITNQRNNGNGKLNSLAKLPYFSVRTLVQDGGAYGKIVLYIKDKAKKDEDGEYIIIANGYVLDELGKEIVRLNPLRKIIEMTKEVKPEIKSEIEKIVMRYST